MYYNCPIFVLIWFIIFLPNLHLFIPYNKIVGEIFSIKVSWYLLKPSCFSDQSIYMNIISKEVLTPSSETFDLQVLVSLVWVLFHNLFIVDNLILPMKPVLYHMDNGTSKFHYRTNK